jgi:hypothetical protein
MSVCYFNLTWPTAAVQTQPLPNGHFLSFIKCRGGPERLELWSLGSFETSKPTKTSKLDLASLLKSNLQKQVRRGKPAAVATAAKLLELDPSEFLRRLVIVSVEDIQIFQETSTVVWLMAAVSKGLILSKIHKDWLLGYVQALVEWPNKMEYDHTPVHKPFDSLDPTLAAINVRVFYGGMAGDMALLQNAIHYHSTSGEPLASLDVQPYTAKLPKFTISPAAIDFHIWDHLLDRLHARFNQYSTEQIKSAIWDNSSSKNYRTEFEPNESALCWSVIRNDFHRLGKEYLSKMILKHPELLNNETHD